MVGYSRYECRGQHPALVVFTAGQVAEPAEIAAVSCDLLQRYAAGELYAVAEMPEGTRPEVEVTGGCVAAGAAHVAAPGLAVGALAVAAVAGGCAGALALAAVGAVVGIAVARVPDGPGGLFPPEYAARPRAVHVIARASSSAAPTVVPGVVAPQAPPAL